MTSSPRLPRGTRTTGSPRGRPGDRAAAAAGAATAAIERRREMPFKMGTAAGDELEAEVQKICLAFQPPDLD